MTNINWKEIEEKLRRALDDYRFRHTLGVAYTAAALAMSHGADVEKARLAGLLHDCAKGIKGQERIALCEKNGIDITPTERENTSLLHSKLGVLFASDLYGINDPEILGAIRWHTTGRPEMSTLEKIVYIADLIEPNRDEMMTIAPEIRTLAFRDLDMGCEAAMAESIRYLRSTDKTMDENTVEAYNYYHKLAENRKISAIQSVCTKNADRL